MSQPTYLDQLQKIRIPPAEEAQSNFSLAFDLDRKPDVEGHLFEIHKRTNAPMEMLRQLSSGQVGLIGEDDRRRRRLTRNARLARWLGGDASRAVVAQDDTKNLDNFMKRMDEYKSIGDYNSTSLPGRAWNTAKAIAVKGVGNLAQTTKGIYQFTGELQAEFLEFLGLKSASDWVKQRTAHGTAEMTESIQNLGREAFGTEEEWRRHQMGRTTVLGIGVDDVGGAAFSLVPTLLVAPQATPYMLDAHAFPMALTRMSMVAGGQSFGSTYGEKRSQGKPFAEAAGWAYLSFAITAALTRYFPGGTERTMINAFKSSPNPKMTLMAALKATGIEGALEAGEEGADGFLQVLLVDGGSPKQAVEALIRDGLVGGLLASGVKGTDIVFMTRMKDAVRTRKLDQSRRNLQKGADASLLVNRSPKMGSELMQSEGDIRNNLYVAPEIIIDMINETPEIADALEDLGITMDKAQAAAKSEVSDMLEISEADLATMPDKALRERLNQVVQEDPGALSMAEASEVDKPAEIERARKDTEELTKERREFDDEVKRLRQEMKADPRIGREQIEGPLKAMSRFALTLNKNTEGAAGTPADILRKVSVRLVEYAKRFDPKAGIIRPPTEARMLDLQNVRTPTKEFGEIEERWNAETIGDVDNVPLADDLMALPGYQTYQKDVAALVQEQLGDEFTAYRTISREQFEEWRQGVELGPMSWTPSRTVVQGWKHLHALQGAERIIIQTQMNPDMVQMRGRPEEDQIVADATRIPFDAISEVTGDVPVPDADPNMFHVREMTQIGDIDLFSEEYFQQDPERRRVDQAQDMFSVVNNRIANEVEIFERLIGPMREALDLPAPGGQPRRSASAWDLGQALFKARDEGVLARLLDPEVDPMVIAKERGLSKLRTEKFLEEVRELRSGNLFGDFDAKGRPILSDNSKAGASVDFILGTCQPTTACKECYAAEAMYRRVHARKAFRNTVNMIVDPKRFAAKIAEEAARYPKSELPFIRLLGSGDMTSTECVDAFNELAQLADRPIHIFSRAHDNLAKLKGTLQAPFIKMGSIDSEIVGELGMDYLKANLAERGINNCFLYTNPSERGMIQELMGADALGLILSANKSLHADLPLEMRIASCPCDADERTHVGSCRMCALSNAGCFMAFADKAIDTNGDIWRIDDAGMPDTAQPALKFFADFEPVQGRTAIAQAYANVVADMMRDSMRLIQNHLRDYRKGLKIGVRIQDIRWRGDAVRLVDRDAYIAREQSKGRDITMADLENTETVIYTTKEDIESTVNAELERLRGQMAKALKEGTFELPGGEIQPPVNYENWQRVEIPRRNQVPVEQQIDEMMGSKVLGDDFETRREVFMGIRELMQLQPKRGVPKGSTFIAHDSFLVNLFENADESTLWAEVPHIFFNMLRTEAAAGNLNEAMLADLDALYDFFADNRAAIEDFIRKNTVDSDEANQKALEWLKQAGDEAWNEAARNVAENIEDAEVSLVLARAFNELLADTMQEYFATAEAPTSALQKAFERFRRWVVELYMAVRQFDVKLTDEVRHVFDRMLATQREIEAMALVRNLMPRSEADWEKIPGVGVATRGKLNQLWSDARKRMENIAIDKRTKAAKALEKGWKAEIANDMSLEPTYIAWDLIKQGGGLDPVSIRNQYDEATVNALKKQGLIAKEDVAGEFFDDISERAGFDTPEDMQIALIKANPPKVEAARRLDMMRMRNDLTYEPAEAVLDTPEFQEALEREGRMFHAALKTGQPAFINTAIRKSAEKAVFDMELREAVRIDKRINALWKYKNEYEKALSRDDYSAAVAANRKARMQLEMAKQCRRIRDARRKREQWAKRIVKRKPGNESGIAYPFHYHLNQQAALWGFVDRIPDMEIPVEPGAATIRGLTSPQIQIVDPQTASDQKPKYVDNPLFQFFAGRKFNPDLMDAPAGRLWARIDQRMAEIREKTGGTPKPYNLMTVEEFTQLEEMLDALHSYGKFEQDKTLWKGSDDEIDLDDFMEQQMELASKLHDSMKVTDKSTFGQWKETFERTKASFAHMDLYLKGMDNMNGFPFRDLDPNAPSTKYGVLRGRMADDVAGKIYKEFRVLDSDYKQLQSAIARLGRFNWKFPPQFGVVRTDVPVSEAMYNIGRKTYTALEVLGAAFYMGNNYGLESLAAGLGFTKANPNGEGEIVDTAPIFELVNGRFTKQDWASIQNIWDKISEILWPRLSQTYQRIYGRPPTKVEGDPFQVKTADGDTITVRGGYMPIHFDPKLSERQARIEEMDMINERIDGTFLPVAARHGMLESRKGVSGKPLMLDPTRVLREHIEFSVRFISHAEHIRDMFRFINHPQYKEMFKRKFSPQVYSKFNGWMRGQLMKESEDLNWVDQLVGSWRPKHAVYVLVGNLKSAINQVDAATGIGANIGMWRYTKSVLYNITHPRQMYQRWQFMMTDEFMAERWRGSQERAFNEVIGRRMKFEAIPGLFRIEKLIKAGTWVGLMPIIIPSLSLEFFGWTAAYDHFLPKVNGDVDKAKSLASELISLTEPATAPKDLSQIQRSRKAGYLMMTLMNTFAITKTDTTGFYLRAMREGKATWAQRTTLLFWTYIVGPALVVSLTWGARSLGRKRDDDEEVLNEAFKDFGEEAVLYAIGGIPFSREMVQMGREMIESKSVAGPAGAKLRTSIGRPFEIHARAAASLLELPFVLGAEDPDPKKINQILWSLADLTAFRSGLPVTQVYKRYKEGWRQYQENNAGLGSIIVPEPGLRKLRK